MAKDYGHALLPADSFEICRAGIETRSLNPRAIAVMKEDGVDITNLASDLIDWDYFQKADLTVTLCGNAQEQSSVIQRHGCVLSDSFLSNRSLLGNRNNIRVFPN